VRTCISTTKRRVVGALDVDDGELELGVDVLVARQMDDLANPP